MYIYTVQHYLSLSEVVFLHIYIYSAIHKAAGFTVPGRSMISTGTVPQFLGNRKMSFGCEWGLPAGTVSGGHCCQWLFGNGW